MVARGAGAAGPVLLACRQWDPLGLAGWLPSLGVGAWRCAPLLPWRVQCPVCVSAPEVGTSQLTLCPSSTNSLEPSPNLVPSEVPASGHHGFVKWGHDAKITKIGVIPTRGSPGQGKANGSQDRRQDLGPISECTT